MADQAPDDSRLLIDKALSRSVILAKSALCDLKRKCCSLALRGLVCDEEAGKNWSSSLRPLELVAEESPLIDSLVEYRRVKVGVISGVGRPAALTETPVLPEEERL